MDNLMPSSLEVPGLAESLWLCCARISIVQKHTHIHIFLKEPGSLLPRWARHVLHLFGRRASQRRAPPQKRAGFPPSPSSPAGSRARTHDPGGNVGPQLCTEVCPLRAQASRRQHTHTNTQPAPTAPPSFGARTALPRGPEAQPQRRVKEEAGDLAQARTRKHVPPRNIPPPTHTHTHLGVPLPLSALPRPASQRRRPAPLHRQPGSLAFAGRPHAARFPAGGGGE